MKGGYQILDLKNTDFTLETASVVSGAYKAVTNGNRKPILIEGLVIGGVKYQSIYVAEPITYGSNLEAIISTATIIVTVEIDDSVTIEEIDGSVEN